MTPSNYLFSTVTIKPGDELIRFFEGHGPQTEGLDKCGSWALPPDTFFHWSGISLVPAEGISAQDLQHLKGAKFRFKFASLTLMKLAGMLILGDAEPLAKHKVKKPVLSVLPNDKPITIVPGEAWLTHLHPPDTIWLGKGEAQAPTPSFRLEAPVEARLVLHGSLRRKAKR